MKNFINKIIDKINLKSYKKIEKDKKDNLELPGIYVQYTVILATPCSTTSIPITKFCFIPENVFNRCEDYHEAYNEVDNYIRQHVVPWMYTHVLEEFKEPYSRYMRGERWYEHH